LHHGELTMVGVGLDRVVGNHGTGMVWDHMVLLAWRATSRVPGSIRVARGISARVSAGPRIRRKLSLAELSGLLAFLLWLIALCGSIVSRGISSVVIIHLLRCLVVSEELPIGLGASFAGHNLLL
jgi:hypothetical protein